MAIINNSPWPENTHWSFAIINGRLAEVWYYRDEEHQPVFIAHCYVKREEYTTKKEQIMIEKDIKKVKLRYVKGKYSKIPSPPKSPPVKQALQPVV